MDPKIPPELAEALAGYDNMHNPQQLFSCGKELLQSTVHVYLQDHQHKKMAPSARLRLSNEISNILALIELQPNISLRDAAQASCDSAKRIALAEDEAENVRMTLRARRAADKAGLILRRARGQTHCNNEGGFMLVDEHNRIVAGQKYELTAEDVIAYCQTRDSD